MSAPSAAFLNVMNKPHDIEHQAWLQVPNGTTTPSRLSTEILLESWKISVDGTSAVRRTLSAEIADATPLLPFDTGSPIAPYGVEIVIESRLVGVFETTEWVTLGTFSVQSPKLTDNGPMQLSITGADRAQQVSASRLVTDYTIAAGTNVASAIQSLISSRVSVPFSATATSATTPLLVLAEQDDPWQRGQEIAGAAGLELYFNPSGICVLRTPPDPSSTASSPAYTFSEGDSLLSVSSEFDSQQSYSHAVFIGEGLDAQIPVRADAYDIDPSSPTYHLGPFGDRPVFLKTNIVSPDPALAALQAQTAADSLLARKRGAFRTIELVGLPVYSLEPSDIVGVDRAQMALTDVFVADSFDLSSDTNAVMNVKTRAVRV